MKLDNSEALLSTKRVTPRLFLIVDKILVKTHEKVFFSKHASCTAIVVFIFSIISILLKINKFFEKNVSLYFDLYLSSPLGHW